MERRFEDAEPSNLRRLGTRFSNAGDRNQVNGVHLEKGNHARRRPAPRQSKEIQRGKAYVVARLEILLQVGCLHLPELPKASDWQRISLTSRSSPVEEEQELADHYSGIRRDADERGGSEAMIPTEVHRAADRVKPAAVA